MHRMERLRRLATKRGMARAARVQKQRRGAGDHRYVLGSFFLDGRRVILRAVECGPGWDIKRPLSLTDDCQFFYRWRTRQAADQFKTRWKVAGVHVWDLAFLQVLAARSDPS